MLKCMWVGSWRCDCLANWACYQLIANQVTSRTSITQSIVCTPTSLCVHHYSGVIMSTMAYQVTSLTSVYSTVYSRRRSKKTLKLRVAGLCEVNSAVTGEFSAQRASNAENVSTWWRHHGTPSLCVHPILTHGSAIGPERWNPENGESHVGEK